MEFYHQRGDCRLCRSGDVEVAVALRPIPIKTPNVGLASDTAAASVRAPLDLYRCLACGHLQLMAVVDPTLQYTKFRYRTSISLGLPEHFVRMAREVTQRLHLFPGASVLEIGSNDGTLLSAFSAEGLTVLGIDPAEEIAAAATAAGIPTMPDFFTSISARRIRKEHGRFDLVVANNTFANLDDLDDIGCALDEVLSESGVLVIETQDGAAVLEHTLIDTIYHEHLSYFLVAPLRSWFERQGLELFDVERQPTKGGSLRLWIQRVAGPHARTNAVAAAIAEEYERGLFDPAVYARFSSDLAAAATELRALIDEHQSGPAPGGIAAYGAAVGTVTLLEQFGLTHTLDFIVDDSPIATEIVGPDYSIPIVGPEALAQHSPSLVIILAHRYADQIVEKRADYLARGGTVAIPLPHLRILEHAA